VLNVAGALAFTMMPGKPIEALGRKKITELTRSLEVYNVAIVSTSQDIRPSIIRVSAEYYLDTTRKVDIVNSL
jgi:hypothetical protein